MFPEISPELRFAIFSALLAGVAWLLRLESQIRTLQGKPTHTPEVVDLQQRVAALEALQTTAFMEHGKRLDRIQGDISQVRDAVVAVLTGSPLRPKV